MSEAFRGPTPATRSLFGGLFRKHGLRHQEQVPRVAEENERVTLIYSLNENNPSRDFSNLTNSRVSGFSCYFNFVNRDFAGAAEKIFVDFVDGRI